LLVSLRGARGDPGLLKPRRAGRAPALWPFAAAGGRHAALRLTTPHWRSSAPCICSRARLSRFRNAAGSTLSSVGLEPLRQIGREVLEGKHRSSVAQLPNVQHAAERDLLGPGRTSQPPSPSRSTSSSMVVPRSMRSPCGETRPEAKHANSGATRFSSGDPQKRPLWGSSWHRLGSGCDASSAVVHAAGWAEVTAFGATNHMRRNRLSRPHSK
jgi:hypothetical protein